MLDRTGKNAWNETFNLWGRRHNETETKTIGKTKIIKAKFKSDDQKPINVDTDNPFRFPGQYEDTETGLYYNRFRYYMPNEGIYTQRDPVGLAGGNPTVYGYVWNSLNESDSFGLECGTEITAQELSELALNSGTNDGYTAGTVSQLTIMQAAQIFTGTKSGRPESAPSGGNITRYTSRDNLRRVRIMVKRDGNVQANFETYNPVNIRERLTNYHVNTDKS